MKKMYDPGTPLVTTQDISVDDKTDMDIDAEKNPIVNGHALDISRDHVECTVCGESEDIPRIFEETGHRQIYLLYAVGRVTQPACLPNAPGGDSGIKAGRTGSEIRTTRIP